MKKEGVGSCFEKVATTDRATLSDVSWYNNNILKFHHFVGSNSVTEVKRFSKAKKETVEMKYTNLIQEYDYHMSGVDLLDSLQTKKVARPNTFPSHRYGYSQGLNIMLHKNKNLDVHLVGFTFTINNLLANTGKDPSAITRRGRPSIEISNTRKPGPKVNKLHTAIHFDSVGQRQVIQDSCCRCQHHKCLEL